jgi:hypothetical protein
MASSARLIGTAGLLAVLLGGCTAPLTSDPSPVPSSSPSVDATAPPAAASSPSPGASSSSASPAPAAPDLASVDRIELDAEELVFLSGSERVTTASLSDAAAVVSPLTTVLGDPQVTETPLSDCAPPSTDYVWPEGVRVVDHHEEERGGVWHVADVFVVLESPSITGASGDRVSLEGPSGISVGGELTTMISTVGDDQKDEYRLEDGTDWTVLLQEGHEEYVARLAPDEPLRAGVAAHTDGTIVSFITSPAILNLEGDC